MRPGPSIDCPVVPWGHDGMVPTKRLIVAERRRRLSGLPADQATDLCTPFVTDRMIGPMEMYRCVTDLV